jgi:hypothetical protein
MEVQMGSPKMLTNGAAKEPNLRFADAARSSSTYFVQVTVKGGDPGARNMLWLRLYEEGFRRCVRGDAGLYRLPSDTFKLTTSDGAAHVHARIRSVLERLQLDAQVLLARCDSFSWSGLDLDAETVAHDMGGPL